MSVKEMIETAKVYKDKKQKSDAMIQINKVTGLGLPNDPSRNNVIIDGQPTPDNVCAALFNGSDIARKICKKLPEDALVKGFQLNMEDIKVSENLIMTSDDRKVVQKVGEAASFARAFGGAAIIMGIDDGQTSEKPVNYNNVKSIYSMDVMDRRYLIPSEWDNDQMSPTFGEPLVYQVHSITGQSTNMSFIHRSRMVIFEGLMCTDDKRLERYGWWLSIFDLVLPAINDMNNAYSLSSQLMNKATQAVFKIKGLAEQISSLNNTSVQARWDIVDAFRSIYRAVVLDSDTEDFTYQEANLSGWSDLLQKQQERVAAAADMPLSILLGMQPGGLSTINESDLRLWYGQVTAYQNQYLKSKIEQIIKMFALAEGIELPEVWSVEFPSPYTPTPSEITARRTAIATIDNQYIVNGTFLPEEVALFRSQENGYDKDMVLNKHGESARAIELNTKYTSVIKSSEVMQPSLPANEIPELSQGEAEVTDQEKTPYETMGLVGAREHAAAMTEHGMDRCIHGRVNRCEHCGIQRVPAIKLVNGKPEHSFKWVAIPDLDKEAFVDNKEHNPYDHDSCGCKKCDTKSDKEELQELIDEIPDTEEAKKKTAIAQRDSEDLFEEKLEKALEPILAAQDITPEMEEELQEKIEEAREDSRKEALALLVGLYGLSTLLGKDKQNKKKSKRAAKGLSDEIKKQKELNPDISVYDLSVLIEWKKKQIAVTENTDAFNTEINNQVNESEENKVKLQQGGLKRVWNAVLDAKTCPICRPLDGTSVPVGQNFTVEPPVHPNCRCNIVLEKV